MAAQHTAGWTRRAFLGGVTVAGVAGLLGLAPRTAAEEPPETTRLRLGRLPAICAAPYYVAAEFLPGEGFTEVHYVEFHGGSFLSPTAAGSIDLGLNFIGPTLTRLDAGDPLVLQSGAHIGCFELFARAGPRRPRLEGQDAGGAAAGQLRAHLHLQHPRLCRHRPPEGGALGHAALRGLDAALRRGEDRRRRGATAPIARTPGAAARPRARQQHTWTGPGPSITAA